MQVPDVDGQHTLPSIMKVCCAPSHYSCSSIVILLRFLVMFRFVPAVIAQDAFSRFESRLQIETWVNWSRRPLHCSDRCDRHPSLCSLFPEGDTSVHSRAIPWAGCDCVSFCVIRSCALHSPTQPCHNSLFPLMSTLAGTLSLWSTLAMLHLIPEQNCKW